MAEPKYKTNRKKNRPKYANGNYKDQQKAYNKTTKGKKLIVAANAINRAKGTYGNGDGKDVAHKPGKEGSKNPKDATLQSQHTNRQCRLKKRNQRLKIRK